MDLETFGGTIYCLGDDFLSGQNLRQRGLAPERSDSEVLTIEIVGEFLGLDTDAGTYRHFRWHRLDLFPMLQCVHRTTFPRQAANLRGARWQPWRAVLGHARSDPLSSIVDSVPMPVCRFARAKRCRLFQGEAAYGRDSLPPGTFYGFRLHLRITWPGPISAFELTPGNAADIAAAPDLLRGRLRLGARRPHLPECPGVPLAPRGTPARARRPHSLPDAHAQAAPLALLARTQAQTH